MGDEQDCTAGLFTGFPDQLLRRERGFHVHCRGRLVQDQQIIASHQDAAERHAGRFAPGELLCALTGQRMDSQRPHQLFRPGGILSVLENILLRAHAEGEALLRQVADGSPGEDRLSGIRRFDPREDPGEGGLPAAVRPDDRRDAFLLQFQFRQAQHRAPGIGLAKCCRLHLLSLPSGSVSTTHPAQVFIKAVVLIGSASPAAGSARC